MNKVGGWFALFYADTKKSSQVLYVRVEAADDDESFRTTLHDYFNTTINLENLTSKWSQADGRLAKVSACVPGLRLLRQDPVECLFSVRNSLCACSKYYTSRSMMAFFCCPQWQMWMA